MYSATKFAIRGMTQCAAMDYAKYGINVNAYAPGAIATPLSMCAFTSYCYLVLIRVVDSVDEMQTKRSGQPKGSFNAAVRSRSECGAQCS